MTKSYFAAVLVICMSLTGVASAQSEEQISSLVAAITAEGCTIDDSTAEAVLASSGLSEEMADDALDTLMQRGDVAGDPARLILTTGDCAAPVVEAVEVIVDTDAVSEAIIWLAARTAPEAADFLAEVITELGCTITENAQDVLEMAAYQAIATRFEFEFPTVLPVENDPGFGGLIAAMDVVGRTGIGHLMRDNRLQSAGNGAATLVGCE